MKQVAEIGQRLKVNRSHQDDTPATTGVQAEWSGSLDPADPDNFWIDDKTGERVNAATGERTTTGAHTATPWHVSKNGNDIENVYAAGVCAMYADESANANAAFIVRAVNSHDKLLAVAKETAAFLDLFYEVSEQAFGDWSGLRDRARAALAAANHD